LPAGLQGLGGTRNEVMVGGALIRSLERASQSYFEYIVKIGAEG
jgi:hypothetical protein